MVKKVRQVYSDRGKLVHKGRLKPDVLSRATSDARSIVERILRARFVEKARPNRD
jgi:hypothetical protein